MEIETVVLVLSRLLFGAVASFFAIMLWARTRDAAWMMIIIGVILNYSEVLYSTLEMFGILKEDALLVYGIPVLRLLLINIPMLFFLGGLVIMVFRKRIR